MNSAGFTFKLSGVGGVVKCEPNFSITLDWVFSEYLAANNLAQEDFKICIRQLTSLPLLWVKL